MNTLFKTSLKAALATGVSYLAFSPLQDLAQEAGVAAASSLCASANDFAIGSYVFNTLEAFVPGAAILGAFCTAYALGYGERLHLRLATTAVVALSFLRPWAEFTYLFPNKGDVLTLNGAAWFADHANYASWGGAATAAILLGGLFQMVSKGPRRHRRIGGRVIIPNGAWQDRWATMLELWWNQRAGWKRGLIIGERYRRDLEPNWQDSPIGALLAKLPLPLTGGGRAPLVRVNPKGHLLTISGSGGGKSSGYAIPNLLVVMDSSFIAMDISQELWRETSRVRELAGRRVLYLDPSDESSWGVNIVAGLGRNAATRDSDAKRVCGWIKSNQKAAGSSGGEMFATLGWVLVQGVIISEMERAGSDGEWALGSVAEIVQLPSAELDVVLTDIYANCPAARQLIGQVLGIKAPETRAGIFANAASYLELFASPSGNRLFSGRADRVFKIGDLLEGRTDLYIRMPRDLIPLYAGGLQLFLGAVNSEIERRGKLKSPLVYLLDEFPQIAGRGTSCAIMLGIETMRKYNVVYWLFAQSRGQYYDIYGEERGKVLEDSCQLRMYIGVEDPSTCEMLSTACGSVTVRQETLTSGESGQSATHDGGGTSKNSGHSEQGQREPLVSVAEIRRMSVYDDVPDEQIIMQRGRRPARVGVCRWYRRPAIKWLHGQAIGRVAAGPTVGEE